MHTTMASPLQFGWFKSLLALSVGDMQDDRRKFAIFTSSELRHAHNRSERVTRALFRSRLTQ